MRKSIFLLLTAFFALALGGCWDKSGDKAASTTAAPTEQAAPTEATPPQPPEAPGVETPQPPQPPADAKPVPEENMAAPKPDDQPQANANGSTVPPVGAGDTIGSAGRIVGDQTRAQADIQSSERAQTGTRPSERPTRPTTLAAGNDDVTGLHEHMPKVVKPEQPSDTTNGDASNGSAASDNGSSSLNGTNESVQQPDGSIKIPDTGQTTPEGAQPDAHDMVVPTVPASQ